MLNFCSLYSGSSGNCLFVESENTKLLIDAGVSLKKIEEGLESLNISSSSLNGILVTHEHSDHIQSLGNLSKKFNLPVFANSETFDAMPKQTDKIATENINKITINEKFCINDIEINSFSIPHDAANPCGFTLSCGNDKISIATDIGHMTNDILKQLEGSKFILLESNYDPEVLKYAKYPFNLKKRIAGPNGHLSNEMAGKVINYLIHDNLQSAMLGHLSKESNFPELAYQTVADEIISAGTDINKIKISVASRDHIGNLIHI
jgi:phosphoribosyl 1,2-cyclic phosphodiesterase